MTRLPAPAPECAPCGDPVPPGLGVMVTTRFPTHLQFRLRSLWCPHCAEHHALECGRCRDRFADTLHWVETDGEPVCWPCYERRFYWRPRRPATPALSPARDT